MTSRIFTPQGFIKSDFHIQPYGRTRSAGRLDAIIVLNTALVNQVDALEKIKEHYELDAEYMFSLVHAGETVGHSDGLVGTWVDKDFHDGATKKESQKKTKNLAEILGLGYVPFTFHIDISGPYSIHYQNEVLAWLGTFEKYLSNEKLPAPEKLIFEGSFEDFKEVAKFYGLIKDKK